MTDADERELEDVEADVLAERGVRGAEVAAVAEQDPLVPLGRHTDARDETEQQRDGPSHQAGSPVDDLVIPVQQIVLGSRRTELGSEAIGDREVDEAEDEERRG